MGENVLGGSTNTDWPNNGSARPTESATICSNSVSGRVGVCERGTWEGLGGGVPGEYWSGLRPEGFVNTGVRSGLDDVPRLLFDPCACVPLHAGLPSIEGSEQSTP